MQVFIKECSVTDHSLPVKEFPPLKNKLSRSTQICSLMPSIRKIGWLNWTSHNFLGEQHQVNKITWMKIKLHFLEVKSVFKIDRTLRYISMTTRKTCMWERTIQTVMLIWATRNRNMPVTLRAREHLEPSSKITKMHGIPRSSRLKEQIKELTRLAREGSHASILPFNSVLKNSSYNSTDHRTLTGSR